MNIIIFLARLVLGLIFTVAALNGFLHFLPMPPKPATAMHFMALLDSTHYMVPVFALQLLGGVLFLINRFLALALAIIAPILVNILLFHVLMDWNGIFPGALATVCWIVLFRSQRQAFAPLFQDKPRRPAVALQG